MSRSAALFIERVVERIVERNAPKYE